MHKLVSWCRRKWRDAPMSSVDEEPQAIKNVFRVLEQGNDDWPTLSSITGSSTKKGTAPGSSDEKGSTDRSAHGKTDNKKGATDEKGSTDGSANGKGATDNNKGATDEKGSTVVDLLTSSQEEDTASERKFTVGSAGDSGEKAEGPGKADQKDKADRSRSPRPRKPPFADDVVKVAQKTPPIKPSDNVMKKPAAQRTAASPEDTCCCCC